MNIVRVNGKRINIPNGHSVSIINGDVFVDGRRYTENENLKQVNIVIEGSCDSLRVYSCNQVEVKGDVRGVLEAGGSVIVHGNAHNKVDAGGDIHCGDVGGDVDAGGSVTCGIVSGSIDAGGPVIRR
ncbi:hypothetical protein IJJ39_00765 [Candidatus Saccharibacteria bacterium]|nr:hypothetical protein [Candidatus Saccharibacteria bacterium]